MTELEQKIYDLGVIPVIKISNPDDAIPLAKALIDGGLPAAEITFRTSCAAEAIKKITKAYPEMLVLAGTVLNPAQVDAAVEARPNRWTHHVMISHADEIDEELLGWIRESAAAADAR